MVQDRVRLGKLFENKFRGTDWEIVRVSPKVKWSGKGRSNIQKIKSLDFKVEDFTPVVSDWSKHDIINKKDGRKRELKKYKIKNLNDWTLYSEPFFKIANKSQTKSITTEKYNLFVENFYSYYSKNGFFENVIREMITNCEGIQFEDGFLYIDKLKFRVIVNKHAWAGYYRIQIQFKLK